MKFGTQDMKGGSLNWGVSLITPTSTGWGLGVAAMDLSCSLPRWGCGSKAEKGPEPERSQSRAAAKGVREGKAKLGWWGGEYCFTLILVAFLFVLARSSRQIHGPSHRVHHGRKGRDRKQTHDGGRERWGTEKTTNESKLWSLPQWHTSSMSQWFLNLPKTVPPTGGQGEARKHPGTYFSPCQSANRLN